MLSLVRREDNGVSNSLIDDCVDLDISNEAHKVESSFSDALVLDPAVTQCRLEIFLQWLMSLT